MYAASMKGNVIKGLWCPSWTVMYTGSIKGFGAYLGEIMGLYFWISRRVRSVLQPESENEVCDSWD